ncbi:sugar ABC transporter substrate-binding protein [Marispirochaeta sp.]|uniref:ABC transporter substrate-binding protein n=1 Tax=Marispirochaeta sp. TaxID=2038653 RepID=UPI0029C724A6|nr:sugar ABC transporter substrate-binding protein [Marispirochaeta sp.]
MKKITVVVVMVVVLSAILSAGAQNEKAVSEQQATTTIQYAFWGNPDAIGVEEEIINIFEAKNPGIKIEPVVSGYDDYHTKLLTLLAGGVPPDVVRIDSYFFQDFMRAKALREISDLIDRDGIDLSKYYPLGVQENTYADGIYGLPWGTAPLYMLLNLKMFRDAGVPLPPMDWDWKDFARITKTLTKGEGAEKQFGFATSVRNLSSILPFVWANGGDLFDPSMTYFAFDKPEAYEAIQKLADLYREGYMPQDALNAPSNTVLNRWFVNNKLAMMGGAASDILTIQNVEGTEFEAWPLPNGRIKKTTVYKSNIVGISSQSKKIDQAWTFLKFLRGPEGVGEELYMKAHRIPPTIDDQKYWEMYADPLKYPKQIAENTTEISKKYGRLLPLRPGWLEVQQLLTPVFQAIFLGEITAEKGMKDIAPSVQAILNKSAH